jgi:hypothetical protein
MNSIALLGFRPRDDRYGIVRVVGRHVVAVQQILLQHTRDRHAVGEKNTKVANCSDEVLATTQSRNLAANALHFLGLCVLLERECERKKEIELFFVACSLSCRRWNGMTITKSAGC